MSTSPLDYCRPIDIVPRRLARTEAENLSEEERRVLEEIGLEGRRYIERRIREFIERVYKEALDTSSPPRSSILVVTGPWGYGKTFLGRDLIRKIALEYGFSYKYVTFEDIIRSIMEEYERNPRDIAVIADQVVSRTLRQAVDDKGLGTILFLDEMEAFLAAKGAAKSGREVDAYSMAARVAVNSLLNILKHLLHSESQHYGDIRGRVHLVLATTPEAYYTLKAWAEDLGVAGRLTRRWDLIVLRPVSKLDMYRLVDEVLEKVYGIPRGIVDENLPNLLYIISNGNLGIAFKILNIIVQASVSECKNLHNRECMCEITDKLLLRILPYREVETIGGRNTRLMNDKIAKTIMESIERYPMSMKEIIKLIATASPIAVETGLASTINNIKNYLEYVLLLGNYDVELYSGPIKEVEKWLTESAQRLSSILNVDVDHVRIALELLVYRDRGNKLIVSLPRSREDYSEIQQLFAAYEIMVSPDHIDMLKEKALLELGKPRTGLQLRLASILALYPAANIRIIPFIRDPEKSREILQEIDSIRGRDPREYNQLVGEAFIEALASMGFARRDEASGKYELIFSYDGVRYSIPLQVYVNEIYDKESLEPVMNISLVYYGYRTPGLETSQWNVIVIPLTYTDIQFLAVIGLINRRSDLREYVDRELVEVFFRQIIEKYSVNSILEEKTRLAYSHGVLVPTTIRGAHILRTGQQDPVIFLRDAYSLLLLGSMNGQVDIGRLAGLLVKLYKTRPYKGRGEKWCNRVHVPAFLSIDLEPENPLDFYTRVEKYKKRLVEKLREFAEAATRSELLEQRSIDVYEVKMHPVEKRIRYILSKIPSGEVELPVLKDKYFAFPIREEDLRRSIKIFDDFFVKLLERRLEIERVPRRKDTIRLVGHSAKSRIVKDTLDKVDRTLNDLRDLDNNIRTLVFGKLEDIVEREEVSKVLGGMDLLSVLMAKERGIKLIGSRDLAGTIEQLKNIVERAGNIVDSLPVVKSLAEYSIYTRDMLNLFNDIYKGVEDFLKNRELRIARIRNDYFNILNLARKLNLNIDTDSIEKHELVSEKQLYKCLYDALSLSREIIDTVLNKNIAGIRKKWPDIVEALWYTNCENKYKFNIILYSLDKCSTCRELDDKLGSLEEESGKIKKLLSEIDATLHRLTPETRKRVVEIFKSKYDKISSLKELLRALNEIRGEVGRITEKIAECNKIVREVEEKNNYLNKILTRIENRVVETRNLVDKLYKIIESVEQLLGDTTTIIKALEENSETITRIAKNIESHREILRKLKEHVNKAKKTCNTEELQRIRAEIFKHENSIERLERSINEIENSVSILIEEVQSKATSKIKPLEDALKAVDKLLERITDMGVKMMLRHKKDQVNETIEKIKSIISGEETTGQIGKLLEEARQKLDEIIRELHKTIDEIVGKGASQVLEEFTKTTIKGEKLSTLVKHIAQKTGLEESQVATLLISLDEKGLIDLRVEAK